MQHFVRYFIKNVKYVSFVDTHPLTPMVISFYIIDKLTLAPPNNLSEKRI